MRNDDVTLIMTVLNEEEGLGGFLRSVEAQAVRPGQMIVVDGGSTDRTVDVIRAWSRTSGVNATVIVEPGANISEGRNRAIEAAETELIAVTDAGTTLHPSWLKNLASQMMPGVDVVSGFFEPDGDTFFERMLAAAITPTASEIDPDTFLPSSRSLLMRKSAWSAAGGYPEWLDYCEDLVFDLEMLGRGATFSFAADAIATWSARPDIRSYAKQYYRYARGDGKAGLWPKRHAVRYTAYLGALALLAVPRARKSVPVLGIVGYGVYSKKFHARLRSRRLQFDRPEYIRAHLLVPVVMIVGDVAKMLGYPAGVGLRRSLHQAKVGVASESRHTPATQ